jgi:hypothetical protein
VQQDVAALQAAMRGTGQQLAPAHARAAAAHLALCRQRGRGCGRGRRRPWTTSAQPCAGEGRVRGRTPCGRALCRVPAGACHGACMLRHPPRVHATNTHRQGVRRRGLGRTRPLPTGRQRPAGQPQGPAGSHWQGAPTGAGPQHSVQARRAAECAGAAGGAPGGRGAGAAAAGGLLVARRWRRHGARFTSASGSAR